MTTTLLYDYSLLPSHIIAQILTNLDIKNRLNAARVCQSWHSASCDPIVTRNVWIKIHNKYEHLEELMNGCHRFGNLLFFETDFNQFGYKQFLTKFGKSIKIVEFDKCVLSLKQLIDCILLMTNLLTFKIRSNKTFETLLNTNKCDFKIIEHNLSRVKNFHVELDSLDFGGLAFLMSMMPYLKTLSFLPPVYCEEDISFKVFFDYINILNDVKLNQLKLGSKYTALPANFFINFAQIKSKPNFQSLILGKVTYLDGFGDFCRKLSNLRGLSMICPLIDQHHIFNISCYMGNLTELNLELLGCLKVQALGSLQHLEKLTLVYYIFTMGTDDENQLIGMFSHLQTLRHLRIDGLISETILTSICNNCKKLTTLELVRLFFNRFSAVFQHLRNLRRLQLFWYRETPIDERNVKNEYDIRNLQLLEELATTTFAPGMTLDLIKQLPKLKKFEQQKEISFLTYYDMDRFSDILNVKDLNN